MGQTDGAPRPRPVRSRSTIKDVAETAGVSRSTASRALTGRGYVAEPVRLRVQAAAAELGYVPDATARHLKAQTSRSVGVLVSDLRNAFYADLAAGASSAARSAGYTFMLADLGNRSADEVEAVEAFVALRVAGVVVTPLSADVSGYLERHGIPVVEVDRQFAPATCDAVVVDNSRAARAMTEHLLDLGHRRIALFIDETDWTTGRDRVAGYRDALTARGLEVDPDLVVSSGWDVAGAQGAAHDLLSRPDRPSAVFAANNVLAEGAWRATRDLSLRIPEDLSLVSFDDAPWMSMVTPGLTAVAQDAVALGEAAIGLLVDRFAHPEAEPQTLVLPALLLERASTAPPAG